MAGRDWFVEAFGAAVTDIRQKLVEEPWFGRAVTPPPHSPQDMAKNLGWELESTPSHEHDRDLER